MGLTKEVTITKNDPEKKTGQATFLERMTEFVISGRTTNMGK